MPITRGQGNPDWTFDETLLALALVQRHWPRLPGKRSAEVKELSDLIRRLPIHADSEKNDRFRNSDGVYLKLQNLASLHPDKADRRGLRTSQTDRLVWSTYGSDPDRVRTLAAAIVKGIDVIGSQSAEIEEDESFEAVEGAVLTRVHLIRERKHGFRARVLRRVERKFGEVACEACEARGLADERTTYAMFEVHHVLPFREASTRLTRTDDLALLCANCHRLIHAAMRASREHLALPDFRDWLRQRTHLAVAVSRVGGN